MQTNVNAIWLFAIASECALHYRTGLVNRYGNPITQFRDRFPDCPRNKQQALLYIHDVLVKNREVLVSKKIPSNLEAIVQEFQVKGIDRKFKQDLVPSLEVVLPDELGGRVNKKMILGCNVELGEHFFKAGTPYLIVYTGNGKMYISIEGRRMMVEYSFPEDTKSIPEPEQAPQAIG